jgi:hypothetical protein
MSMTLFPLPVGEMSAVVAEWGGKLFYDGAHQAGLIAAGQFQDPLNEGAAVLTGSAGKTFSGPQSGIILWNDAQLTGPLTEAIFLVLVATHQVNRVAALAVSGETGETRFRSTGCRGFQATAADSLLLLRKRPASAQIRMSRRHFSWQVQIQRVQARHTRKAGLERKTLSYEAVIRLEGPENDRGRLLRSESGSPRCHRCRQHNLLPW